MNETADSKVTLKDVLFVKLTSRKFLLTATAALVDVILMLTGQVDGTIGIPALVALISAFNIGQGIADKQ